MLNRDNAIDSSTAPNSVRTIKNQIGNRRVISFVGDMSENINQLIDSINCSCHAATSMRYILIAYAKKLLKVKQERDILKQRTKEIQIENERQLSLLRKQVQRLKLYAQGRLNIYQGYINCPQAALDLAFNPLEQDDQASENTYLDANSEQYSIGNFFQSSHNKLYLPHSQLQSLCNQQLRQLSQKYNLEACELKKIISNCRKDYIKEQMEEREIRKCLRPKRVEEYNQLYMTSKKIP